jgi:hypothetical protein
MKVTGVTEDEIGLLLAALDSHVENKAMSDSMGLIFGSLVDTLKCNNKAELDMAIENREIELATKQVLGEQAKKELKRQVEIVKAKLVLNRED